MQLEHATIPPYLTALYSIHPGTNADAAHVIRVVAVEEMLHLTLAANVLNAVGGTPDLTAPDFVPTYPAHLPDGEDDFEVEPAARSPGGGRDVPEDRAARARGGRDEHRAWWSAEAGHRGALRASRVRRRRGPMHFYSIGEF